MSYRFFVNCTFSSTFIDQPLAVLSFLLTFCDKPFRRQTSRQSSPLRKSAAFIRNAEDDNSIAAALWSRESVGARRRRQMAVRVSQTAHHCCRPTNPRSCHSSSDSASATATRRQDTANFFIFTPSTINRRIKQLW